jgi:hypothetical protein
MAPSDQQWGGSGGNRDEKREHDEVGQNPHQERTVVKHADLGLARSIVGYTSVQTQEERVLEGPNVDWDRVWIKRPFKEHFSRQAQGYPHPVVVPVIGKEFGVAGIEMEFTEVDIEFSPCR